MAQPQTSANKRRDKDGNAMRFIGAYVSAELKAELQEWAKEEDRTLSQQVTRLLRGAVEARQASRE